MFIEFLERGLSVIPIHKSKKNPVLEAWSQFCERLPSDSEAIDWDKKFADFNIGVALGPASNLIAVDIDTNDERILAACPPSPVRRRGQKGEARFFQYNPEIPSQKIGQIDILSLGRQVVLPPSIHPITLKPYEWLTKDTLENFSISDLPTLTLDHIKTMQALYGIVPERSPIELSGTFQSEDRSYPHGSQDRLKTLATALLHQYKSTDEAVEELLKYDELHHKPLGYFSARGEHGDAKADPRTNALRFYSSIASSINTSKLKKGESPLLPTALPVVSILDRVGFQSKAYPEARGLMGLFQKACSLSAIGKQDALSLGGALALMAALCSNRFASRISTYTITPNLYILNLAPSGAGKETCQNILHILLQDSDLIGAALYRSGSSIVKNLPKQQERLDIIDEASSLLKAMNSEQDYKREMVEILSSLFSKASTHFSGITSATEGVRQGAVYNPHINILASTTPHGFHESVTRSMESKGLMPRFLTFYQRHSGKFRRKTLEELEQMRAVLAEAKIAVKKILDFPKRRSKDCIPGKNYLAKHQGMNGEDLSMGIQYQPAQLLFTPEAEEAFFSFQEHCYEKTHENADDFEAAFYGRLAEMSAKVALLDAVSLSKKEIDVDSYLWAKEVVEAQWFNSKGLYELASGDSQFETAVLKVKKIIEDAGVISKRDLGRKTQHLDKRTRDSILHSLIETELIEACQIEGKVKKKDGYRWIDHS